MKARIGVDVGGTNIVCGVVSPEGDLIHKIKKPTEARLGEAHVIAKIADMCREAAAGAGLSMQDIAGVGVGTPGLVDHARGVVVFATNLKWHNVALADRLSSELGVPVKTDNDVKMYAFGEAMRGAGRGYRNVLGITLGTGVASAMINDGRLYYGGGFMAGELGHICFDEIPFACGCGLHGCVETVASATGLVRQAKTQLESGRESVLAAKYNQDPDALTAADITAAYDAGDALAMDIMAFTGRMLGKGLAHAITFYSPDIVVIGGGASQAGDRIFNPMKEQIQKVLLPMLWERVSFAPAELLDDAGVIGSALYASE